MRNDLSGGREREEALRARGGREIFPSDAEYPALLREIPRPPNRLWARGLSLATGPAVAVVGARRASRAGLAAAGHLARGLARAGVTVVSGFARGIDAAAHRAALEAGGTTVAVFGCGLDVCYPPEHAGLLEELVRSGTALSEFDPGERPLPYYFPIRNRIIAGLSRLVLVVEAADRSGSLITAAAALEQGREVMAVPGSVLTDRHHGAHALIRDGATLITGVEDVLASLGRLPLGEDPRASADGPTGDPVLDALPIGESCPLDAIAARTGLQPAVLLARLLGLEVAGVVRRAEGGLFVRPGRSC